MKNLVNMISYALIILVSIFASMSLASCGADESYTSDRIVQPAPKDTIPTKKDTIPTTPDPKPSFIWDRCMEQNVTFYPETDSVLATNIWQVTENGEATFVDAVMRYKYEIDFTAPTRVVTSAQDTTVYAGGGLFKSDYSNYRRVDKDSLWDVNSYIEGGYKTQYYTMSLKTSRMEGIDLRGGKENRYFNVSETPTIKSIWHEDIYEVESNDSIFNRETVHNVLLITLTGTKGNKWYVTREKIVVVDHFVKVKEGEKKEEVKADYWVNNLKRFISCTKVWRDDTKSWSDAYLFECKDTYEIIIANYIVKHKDNKDVETFTGVEHKSVSKSVCPESGDYNGVIQVGGNFYPAAITIQSDGWDVIGYINGKVESQTHADQFANNSGIKNQNKNNNAKPSPFITTTKVENKVNGKLVIKVTAKTTTHTGVFTVADSSLK